MDNRKVIYLDDAINTMRQHSHYDDFDRCVIDESDAMKALKDLPSAQPEYMDCLNKTVNLQTGQPLAVQLAYQRGISDGIEQCTERIKRFMIERGRQDE